MSDQLKSSSSRLAPGPRWIIALIAALIVLVGSAVVVPLAVAAAKKPTGFAATSQGMDTVELTWTSVAGAKAYDVQYAASSSFKSATTVKTTTTDYWVQGLTRNKKYYFRVAVNDGTSSRVWSDVKSATPKYLYTAPTSLATTNVGGTFVDLAWPYVLGAPAYRLIATPTKGGASISSDSDNSDGNGRVSGLKKNTRYKIKVAVLLAATKTSPAVRMSPYSTASVTVTTSNYPVEAPLNVILKSRTAESLTLSWKAPGNFKTGYFYQIQYALNRTMSRSAKYAATTTSTTQTLKGLTDNTDYYVRVRVVDGSKRQKSDYSDSQQAKTPTKFGTIVGTVSGPPSSDVVVNAYGTSGRLVDTANVSGGKYTLTVRPGSYRVQATYLGNAGFTSLWAASGSQGGRIPSEATQVKVNYDQTTTAPAVTLTKGATVTGTIYDAGNKPIAKAGMVDVSLRNGNTGSREVIAQARNESDGGYALRGIPNGTWWLRFVYNLGDGFEARSIKVTVSGGTVTSYQYSDSQNAVKASKVPANLENASFRQKFGVTITGKKSKGHKLTAHAKAWLAGEYPTTYAKMSYQWRRNGVNISGATKSTYTLTSADRGKSISVKVYATKYGYSTGTATSTSYRIS
ncbi:MAG: fibronectin type III domain-containing protein [Micropruina sp.]|uniref:fibronectin type III domain-containing protein n=1 Tax=Micropruina sp. TaxID=2737536 RepID=UPI0039E23335